MRYIDLRSDTVTQPTQAMRDAMATAVVGDDVFDDDPTLHELEAYAAERLGKEAAVFVTSGMQGNACALLAHTRRGDCVIIDPHSHIADHEAGSYAQLSGVSLRFPQSVNGTMNPDSVRACLTDDSDVQVAPATLVVVENAHSSGAVVSLDNMRDIYQIAHENGVAVHLDGARLFNAAAALGVSDVRELTQYCDTVMCCLSKGLCAPVGSILAGPKALIWRARRARRILGGGMRQAGFLAAAGLVALRDMTGRVKEDHENAAHLGALLDAIDGVHILRDRLDIDMVFFTTDWDTDKAARYPAWMLEHGIKVTGCMGGEYRMVCHHDISRADCEQTAQLVGAFAAEG
nr:GntG family PLP-dependent aldolase [uncultured Agathobaculum sp.]